MLITLFNAGGKGIGFLREVVFAANFGIEKDLDIYFVSSIIPLLISTSIYYIAQNYLIPQFSEKKTETDALPLLLLRRALFSGLLISIVMVVFLFIMKSMVLGYFFAPTDQYALSLGGNIYNLYIFTIPVYTVISILTAWKYFSFDYLQPLISQLWANVSIIMFVLILSSRTGSEAIAIGYLFGTLFQVLHLLWICRNDIIIREKNSEGYTKIFKVTSGLLIIFFIEFVGQLMPFVDRSFYSQLPSGTIAAYNYALTIMMLPISIVAMGFSTALFPQISELHSNRNAILLQQKLTTSFELIIFLFLPIQLLIMLFPQEILSMIFVASKFSGSDSKMIADSLMILGSSIIFYSLFAVISKFFYGISKSGLLLIVIVAGFLIKIFVNIFLLERGGYITIALSSAIAFAVMFLTGAYLLFKELDLSIFSNGKSYLRIFAAFLLPAALTIGVKVSWTDITEYEIISVMLLSVLLYIFVSSRLNVSVLKLMLNFFVPAKQ